MDKIAINTELATARSHVRYGNHGKAIDVLIGLVEKLSGVTDQAPAPIDPSHGAATPPPSSPDPAKAD